jgi:hypothetical protein
MPGIEGKVIIGYSKDNAVPNWSYIGNFVESRFDESANAITQVDGATERVSLQDQDYRILSLNERGLVNYTKITGVTRYTLANDLDWSLYYTNGIGFACSADTRIANRVTDPVNVIDGQLVTDLVDGDVLPTSLWRHTISNNGNVASELHVPANESFPVPRIVTATWGEISLSRNDCRLFIDLITEHPEDLDQSDIEVFNRVVDEETMYVYIGGRDDVKATWLPEHVPKKLYYIETESGTFNTHYGWSIGHPVALDTLQASAPKTEAGKPKQTANVDEILAKYGKKRAE